MTKLARAPQRLLERHIAVDAVATNPQGGEREIAEVAHFQDLNAEVGENGEQVFANTVVTAVLGPPSIWAKRVVNSTSGSMSARKASRSRRFKAS